MSATAAAPAARPPGVLQQLLDRFDPHVIDVRGGRARIRLDVSDGDSWDVLLRGPHAWLEPPLERVNPDALLSADTATWDRVARDLRGGMDAFRRGRLRVRTNLHLGVGFLAATSGMTDPARLRFESVDTSAGRLSTMQAGAGPPVLAIHGLGGTKASFLPTIAALAGSHRVIAVDLPGFGESDKPIAAPYDAPWFARAVTGLLDALGIERAALWGHSDGAVIAAWAAILHPERIGALVLEALHFFAAKTSSIPFFEMAIEAPHRFGPAVVNALERDHGEGWRTVIAAGGRAWLDIIGRGRERGGDLFDGRLGEVRAPTLLLHGRRDPRTEPGEIEAAVAALTPAGARCELLDAGHSPHTSAAAATRCVELASAFLAELE